MIRAARPSDLADFLALATLAGPGFTSLPANEGLLAERLARSQLAFAGGSGALILALEDQGSGHVIGCAAIKVVAGPRPDFLNFLVADDHATFAPTSSYGDLSEVGSLFLHPRYRRDGLGRWLARSRYLLIAAAPDRFGGRLFSELRGVIDGLGRSPFYDAVGAAHFGMSFQEADRLCAHGREGELNAMLPTTPFRMDGLDPPARAAIGRPHRQGDRALGFLEEEGFRFEGVIDLLDGGPLVVAESRHIRTIRASFLAAIGGGDVDGDDARPAVIAGGAGANFRCCRASVVERNRSLTCRPEVLQALGVANGATVRVCFDSRTSRWPLSGAVLAGCDANREG